MFYFFVVWWFRLFIDLVFEFCWGYYVGMQIGILLIFGFWGFFCVFIFYFEYYCEWLVNFIVVELIFQGVDECGYLEMEQSIFDFGVQGKWFWLFDDVEVVEDVLLLMVVWGVIEMVGGVEIFIVWIGVECFDNGVDVCV